MPTFRIQPTKANQPRTPEDDPHYSNELGPLPAGIGEVRITFVDLDMTNPALVGEFVELGIQVSEMVMENWQTLAGTRFSAGYTPPPGKAAYYIQTSLARWAGYRVRIYYRNTWLVQFGLDAFYELV